MRRFAFNLALAMDVLLSLLLTPPLGAASDSQKNTKVYGEVRPDAALVYVCGAVKDSFFIDDQFVINLSGWRSRCAFTHLSPGTHVLWDRYSRSWLGDYAPGQTYYYWKLLSEVPEGQKLIEKAEQFVEPTQEERSEAASTVAKKWPALKTKLQSKLALTSEIVYAPPASTDSMIRIAAGTTVNVELMENLNSALNVPGDNVLVRTAEDVRAGDNLFVRAGTPVRALIRDAHKNSRLSRGGDIDVTMLSVPAADGTVCPLVGQAFGYGTEWLNRPALLGAAAAGGIVGGAVLHALMKGAVAFIPSGALFKVFTKQDIWIRPYQTATDTNSGIGKPSDIVRAYARNRIAGNLVEGEIPQIAEIVFDCAVDITEAEVLEVAGWQIPTPVHARSMSRAKEGWIAQFGGWDVCRLIRLGDAGTQLAFRLTTADGSVVIAQGSVSMTLQQ